MLIKNLLSKRYTEIMPSGRHNLRIVSSELIDISKGLQKMCGGHYSGLLTIGLKWRRVWLYCTKLREMTGNKSLSVETFRKTCFADLDHFFFFTSTNVEKDYYIILKQLVSTYFYIENLRKACSDIYTWEETNEDLLNASKLLEQFNEQLIKDIIKKVLMELIEMTVLYKNWNDKNLSFILGKLSNQFIHGKYIRAALEIVGLPFNMNMMYDDWDSYPVEEMW